MITQEDYQFISSFESSNGEQRNQFLQQNRNQCSKTFLSLLSHISKDQTIQYVLCMLDDLILEDKSRVEIFKEYSKKKKESVWDPFLNLLNRNDGFIQNMVRLLFSVKTFRNYLKLIIKIIIIFLFIHFLSENIFTFHCFAYYSFDLITNKVLIIFKNII